MMIVNPLSQRDPRWAKKTLGFSRLTIGNYGCTLTALTCLINYLYPLSFTPDAVNEKLKSVGAFSGALILWSRVQLAFPKLTWKTRGYNYNNVMVSFYVYGKSIPVLVEVNAASIGAPRHWVLYIGGQKAMDPWVGKIVPTSKYPATGYSLFDRS